MIRREVLVFDAADRIGDLVTRSVRDVTVHRFADFLALAEHIDQDPGVLTLMAVVSPDVTENLHKLTLFHEEYPSVPIVLILPTCDEVDPVLLVRTGAIELLYESSEPSEIEEALQRSVRIGTAASELGGQFGRRHSCNVVAFASPVGGAGRTFLATNAAAWYQQNGYGDVCLVDLSGPYGAASTALRVRPPFSVAQAALAATNSDELALHLDEYLVRHGVGFNVLAAGNELEAWKNLDPRSVGPLLAALVERHDVVVIDEPVGLSDLVLATLPTVTALAVTIRLDVPSVRALRLFLRQLDDLDFERSKVSVLLNQIKSGTGLEAADVMEYLADYESRWIPANDQVAESLNSGELLVVDKPRHLVSEVLAITYPKLGTTMAPAAVKSDNATGDLQTGKLKTRNAAQQLLARIKRGR